MANCFPLLQRIGSDLRGRIAPPNDQTNFILPSFVFVVTIFDMAQGERTVFVPTFLPTSQTHLASYDGADGLTTFTRADEGRMVFPHNSPLGIVTRSDHIEGSTILFPTIQQPGTRFDNLRGHELTHSEPLYLFALRDPHVMDNLVDQVITQLNKYGFNPARRGSRINVRFGFHALFSHHSLCDRCTVGFVGSHISREQDSVYRTIEAALHCRTSINGAQYASLDPNFIMTTFALVSHPFSEQSFGHEQVVEPKRHKKVEPHHNHYNPGSFLRFAGNTIDLDVIARSRRSPVFEIVLPTERPRSSDRSFALGQMFMSGSKAGKDQYTNVDGKLAEGFRRFQQEPRQYVSILRYEGEEFIEEPMPRDGDCGYRAVGLNRSEALRLLMENMEHPEVLEILSRSFQDAFLQQRLPRIILSRSDVQHTRRDFFNGKLSRREETLRELSLNRGILEQFLAHTITSGAWISDELIAAIAWLQNRQIRIFRHLHQGNLSLVACLGPTGNGPGLDLLYTNGDTHFNRLRRKS